MTRLALLHTAASNAALFEAARRDLGLDVTLTHHVRADLLAEAEAAGGLTPALAERTRAELTRLGADADRVVLTCSTLGLAVEGTCAVRVDAALARRAVRDGGRVVVLCTAPTTLASTRALFLEAAKTTGANVELRTVAKGWTAFKAGEFERYYGLIVIAANAAMNDGADIVALAQVSMAGANHLCRGGGQVLTSPEAGLQAAVKGLMGFGV